LNFNSPDFPGETFRVLKEKEEREYGEYRKRRLVLESWDELEAKCLAPISLRTNSDMRRDQVTRYLDLAAYHYLNHPDSVKEFYFVLIIDTEKQPWILTRYRYNQNLIKGLTNPCLFKPPVDAGRLLSKGIGWLTWKQLQKDLGNHKGPIQNPYRKEVRRRPYCLPGLQDQGGRTYPNREKTVKFLVNHILLKL